MAGAMYALVVGDGVAVEALVFCRRSATIPCSVIIHWGPGNIRTFTVRIIIWGMHGLRGSPCHT